MIHLVIIAGTWIGHAIHAASFAGHLHHIAVKAWELMRAGRLGSSAEALKQSGRDQALY